MGRLVRLVRSSAPPAADLFAQLLGSTLAPKLPWVAFAHLRRVAEVAATLLTAALVGRERGVNILLYGPPGTGKTTFAAALAHRTGAKLRPVTEQDAHGGEPNRHERLHGLQLAQQLAPPGETVLLFDEAEDVFVGHIFGEDGPLATSRVFMHRLLEQAPVPVIWTANDITAFGPAVLRRMTMCLELKIPGVTVRTRLWRSMGEAAGVRLSGADAASLARLVPAAPAVASTALRGWWMLTLMEQHPLPFACTTNLPDRLDPASLRRFLVKLRLDWPTQAQARLAFLAADAPNGLDALRTLTPADFALVQRRAVVTGEADPAGLLCLLAAECDGPRVPVGFRAA